MSVTERNPVLAEGGPAEPGRAPRRDVPEVLLPREVPLGGPRAMPVHRTPAAAAPLPDRRVVLRRPLRPDDVSPPAGCACRPHPHTGLQTVTWLFDGRGGAPRQRRDARDRAARRAEPHDGRARHRPLGVLDAGTTTLLHGAQLWVALPDGAPARRRGLRALRARPCPGRRRRRCACSSARWLGATAPARTFTRLVGAEVRLAAGATLARRRSTRPSSTACSSTRARSRSTAAGSSAAQLVSLPAGRDELVLEAHRRAGAACSCSAASRSASRSSCGGTSSAATTTRSSRPAPTGSARWSSSARRGTRTAASARIRRLATTCCRRPELPTVRLKPRS